MHPHDRMKFCSECGSPDVAWRIPDGDTVPREVCGACGAIHYRNPKVVVGCLATWEDRVLLCRRAFEPRHGLWTLPAGFMENGETLAAGAARETIEEILQLLRGWAPDVIRLLRRAGYFDLPRDSTKRAQIAKKIGLDVVAHLREHRSTAARVTDTP